MQKRHKREAGQTLIFVLIILVILFVAVLWNYDLHRILYVKTLSQNAGDSSALAAARWQAITLNIVGELNIMHAIALSSSEPDIQETADAFPRIQSRLCFTGPMVALVASQQAAKKNGIYNNAEYTKYFENHASKVENFYPLIFTEPYENGWVEYADMIRAVAADGIAAGPDNTHFYSDYSGGHHLLDIDFYNAIAGKIWCWFWLNDRDLLGDYTNYGWWDDLPNINRIGYANSEFFSLGLTKKTTSLEEEVDIETISALAEEQGMEGSISSEGMSTNATWFCYHTNFWNEWSQMATEDSHDFPLTGTLLPKYNYSGADSAIRVQAKVKRLTPGANAADIEDKVTWTAAAKTFGYLSGELLPTEFSIVLPAYHDIRLIPVDASSIPSGGSFNLAWRKHIEEHLFGYVDKGPSGGAADCYFCQQLTTWENDAFREGGIEWLEENSALCVLPAGPGGRGGGSPRGH